MPLWRRLSWRGSRHEPDEPYLLTPCGCDLKGGTGELFTGDVSCHHDDECFFFKTIPTWNDVGSSRCAGESRLCPRCHVSIQRVFRQAADSGWRRPRCHCWNIRYFKAVSFPLLIYSISNQAIKSPSHFGAIHSKLYFCPISPLICYIR